MARMHSRKKGKSGSTKPVKTALPSWVKYKSKEVELLIVKYAKEGLSASRIGVRLRDRYGIPDVKIVVGKSISEILKEKGILNEIPEDLLALIRKSIFVRKHLESNKHDEPAKRGLILTDSKIHRLVKYYKRTERLSATWKFDPKKTGYYLE
ncbi:MAG: 30S ribosomal protein S15 [Nanoarchaeota archaeon]|nr:30S ribosomal protein S15 [Nanoarchaeota archaeon]MBU1854106.1 30S ribosomal protein S15 [Nanoarchaeota archaeon]